MTETYTYAVDNLKHTCRECPKPAIVHFTGTRVPSGYYCSAHGPKMEAAAEVAGIRGGK